MASPNGPDLGLSGVIKHVKAEPTNFARRFSGSFPHHGSPLQPGNVGNVFAKMRLLIGRGDPEGLQTGSSKLSQLS